MKLFWKTSSIFQLDNIKNAAIQRVCLNFCTWQHQKQSNSARLPFFKLTTSKTKQFCKTSFKNGKLSAELTASCHCVLRFFQSICLNYCACHKKVMPGHTKCCTCHAKSSQQPEDLRLQNATLLRKSAPGPPNSSDEHVSCTAPATENASLQMLFKCPTPAIFFGNATKPSRFAHFSLANVLHATTAYTFSTSQLPKVVRTWCVLYILTWKCASRHNGVQFFISHLARWLRTRRFSEPTFRPSGATNHWKNTAFRDFPTFSRTCTSFFWLFLFSGLLSFCSSLLFSSAPPLLFICPYCRKFDF